MTKGGTDFTKTGPWYMVLITADGTQYKVSGHITHVTPQRSIGYTWGWHDDADQRGEESFVTLTVEPATKGSKLIVDHRGLGDDEIGASHTQGWNSSLSSLSKTVSASSVEDNGGSNPLSGFSIVEAGSVEEALEMAKGCPILENGAGTVEVSPIMDM